jgi:hypothetical protein
MNKTISNVLNFVASCILSIAKGLIWFSTKISDFSLRVKLGGAELARKQKRWADASKKANMPIYMVAGYPILAKHKRHAIRKYKHLMINEKLNRDFPT